MTIFEKAARAHAASRSAPGTRYLYALDLSRWLTFCKERGCDPATPTLELATAFRDVLTKKQAPQTVRRTLTALYRMYRFALEREHRIVTWNPFSPEALTRPSADAYTRTEAFTGEEAEALIAKATGRDRVVLLLMYETGLRRASVASLRRDDLFRRGDEVLLLHTVVKGGKRREVEVPGRSEVALLRWLSIAPESKFIFPDKRGRAIDPRIINKIVLRVAAKAGVTHAHPHRFRASYATAALDAGVPLHDVQASMHHATPDTTLRYDRGKRGIGVATAVAKFRAKEKTNQ